MRVGLAKFAAMLSLAESERIQYPFGRRSSGPSGQQIIRDTVRGFMYPHFKHKRAASIKKRRRKAVQASRRKNRRK